VPGSDADKKLERVPTNHACKKLVSVIAGNSPVLEYVVKAVSMADICQDFY
jgi:hypothetical protein